MIGIRIRFDTSPTKDELDAARARGDSVFDYKYGRAWFYWGLVWVFPWRPLVPAVVGVATLVILGPVMGLGPGVSILIGAVVGLMEWALQEEIFKPPRRKGETDLD